MATVRLVPSTYYLSSSYLTVSSANNMYTNTDSTTSGTVTNTRSSTSSYYIYLRGFNFSAVPEDAIVSSISIKLKASHSGGNTSTIYCYDNTTQVSACGRATALGTSATVKTFTNTTVDWDTLKGYGSDFGIRINCRRSSKNTQAVITIYGAEIEVTYTIPVYHHVTVTGDSTKVTPTGTESVLEGESYLVKCYYDERPTVTDNNVDVSSQLTQQQDSPESYTVTNVTTTYGFALNGSGYYESNNQGRSNTCALARISFSLPVRANIVFTVINYAESTYDYGLLSEVDEQLNTNASADSSNVYWSGKNNNSSSPQTVTYSNVSAGTHTIDAKYFKDQYTDSNNDSLQFKVTITLLEPVTYQTYWLYTVSNITADHTIVVTAPAQNTLYIKLNGTWTAATAVYKKVSGSWVQQTDLTNVFNSGTNYKYNG